MGGGKLLNFNNLHYIIFINHAVTSAKAATK